MKSIVSILVCAGAVFFAACSSQTKSDKDDTKTLMKTEEEARQQAPERMQVSDVKDTITYKGKKYQWTVVRTPDASLPIVSNQEGKRFVDNRISFRLTCSGRQLLDKSFTKADFANWVDAAFMKHALLEGLVFDKVSPQGLLFAASVGYPDSDLYQPIRLLVTADGKLSMSKEDVLEDSLPETVTPDSVAQR